MASVILVGLGADSGGGSSSLTYENTDPVTYEKERRKNA